MRWSSRVVLTLFVAVVAGALLAPAAFARPDLTISSLAEPPDGAARGSAFQESYTVSNQGRNSTRRSTTVRFYLTHKQGNPRKGDFRLKANGRKATVHRLHGLNELARRIKLRLPSSVPNGFFYLAACVDKTKKIKETLESNNCRITGQVMGVGQPLTGPAGPSGSSTNQIRIPRQSLAIGRATVQGVNVSKPFGDDEKSNVRRTLFARGPIAVVADCKRTTNGDNGNPNSAPSAVPGDRNEFDEDGDEAKLLVYTSSGNVTFSSLGASSRRNIGPGLGSPAANDHNNHPNNVPGEALRERTGGEGKHMALAAARDPDQAFPESDWATAFKVGNIYVAHSNGTEFSFNGYAGIDVLGANDRCVFGGLVTVING